MSFSKPSGSKRKITYEHRNFQEKWELEFFCCEVKDKIICLVSNSTISVPKLYNIKRHYDQHKAKYDQFKGLIRDEKLNENQRLEELLELVPLHDTTTGENILNAVYELLQKYNLNVTKMSSVATDGAPSMTVVHNGFVNLLKKKIKETNNIETDLHHVHCKIHQEILCSKVIKLEYVLKAVKKMINFIRSRGLNQRQFAAFLHDIESEYTGLPYYTEVRWLSCSMVLDRLWKLKEEICLFMEVKGQDVYLLSDKSCLQDLSFMVDITKHLSELNTKLQGPLQMITDMYNQVKAFKCKLMLWEKQLEVDNLSHFPTCKAFKESTSDTISYKKYTGKIKNLQEEFERRFQDFKLQEDHFSLFTGLFSVDVEKVTVHLQMEVVEIQCQTHLKQKFDSVGALDFYKFLPAEYQEIRKFACKIISMFGSTYKCEQLFSLMQGNKSPARSRLTDAHLGSVLKLISADKVTPQIDNLIKQKRCQISGKKL
ncbi:hypothetical protein ABMA28_003637 [Loxostege sticticalis]|uniref:Uncharacterized protein n=1 Tax=Loxostege sticticalis TaxID=481309 RepID=A0ABD0SWV6_LOXSC